jgi:TatA/E family protein of Tat protein translocase
MFGLGPTELIVILVLALVLLGPNKLPGVAVSLGKAIRQFRKATQDLSNQLDIDEEVKAPFRELKAAIRDEPPPYVPPAPPPSTVAAVKTEAKSDPKVEPPPAEANVEAKLEDKIATPTSATTVPPKAS